MIRNKKAFTLVEILVAFAILTSAIIPVVTVINYYGKESSWNEYYSFALTIGSNTIKNIEQLKTRDLKKAIGHKSDFEFTASIMDENRNVLLDLDEISHKGVKYGQKVRIKKVYPEFSLFINNILKKHKSSRALYVFNCSVIWTGKNNRKQELDFEYFKGDL